MKPKKKDFERKKAKVGRLKPGAASATSTAFVAKAVQVKDQAIPDEEDIQLRRKDQLARVQLHLSQLGHYSAPFRKEAVVNLLKTLKELPQAHLHLTMIVSGLLRVIVDDDSLVRKTAFPIWQWVFDARSDWPDKIGSLMVLVVPHLVLGLTHLKKDICADTAKILLAVLKGHARCMKPFAFQILPSVAKHFSQKSFAETKKSSAVDIVELFALIADILGSLGDAAETSALEYQWSPRQAISLRLPPRQPKTEVMIAEETQLESIISPVMKAAIPVWSEVGYLLSSPSFAVSGSSDERAVFARCFRVLAACHKLCTLNACSLNKFVPSKIASGNNWAQTIGRIERDMSFQ